MRNPYFVALLIAAQCFSQAQADPPKHPFKPADLDRAVPPLDPARARLVIYAGHSESPGSAEFGQLSGPHETGQIYFNGQAIGTMAKASYLVIDVLPGAYEAHWVPDQPDAGVYVEPENLTFTAGQVRFLVCNMKAPPAPFSPWGMLGGGLIGGAIVGLAMSHDAAKQANGTNANFSHKTIIRDRPMEKATQFVSYQKLDLPAANLTNAAQAPIATEVPATTNE